MCLTCVKADFPIAERILLSAADSSRAASSNFKSCARCGRRDLAVTKYSDSEEQLVHGHKRRNVSFYHACGVCGHEVAEHSCSILVDGSSREVDMTCMLCGTFEDVYEVDVQVDEVRPEAITR